MKKLLIVAVVAASLMTSCKFETKYGDCVGLGSDKDPNLKYEMSTWNAIMGVVFFETVIVPVVWLTSATFCPEGKK